jgi:voltage-gated sodium channel
MLNSLLSKLKKNENNWFDNFIFVIIILSSILVGIETHFHIIDNNLFAIVDIIILLLFLVEILLKMFSNYPNPFNYFKNGWNIFDFIIVILVVLPYFFNLDAESKHAFVALRLLRVFRALRLLRLVTHLKELQILVETTLKSLKSIVYVMMILGILFYIYCILGTNIFGHLDYYVKSKNKTENERIYFQDLYYSSLNLFSCMNGDFDMYEIINDMENKKRRLEQFKPEKTMPYDNYLWLTIPLFYGSFFLLGGLIVLNLFIGVIVSELEQAKNKTMIDGSKTEILSHINTIEEQLKLLQNSLKNKE